MEAGTGKRARKALLYLLAFFIVLMIFSSYSNTFTSPPYLDDFHSFIYQKSLYLHSITFSNLLSLSGTGFGWARFLPMVTLALNLSLGQGNLIYFHAVNLLVHLLAFFAVFWLVRQVVAAGRSKSGGEVPSEMERFFPLCVAAIWALSPVQTSAVTYLVQRMASMQALFFTLSVAGYIKARLLSGKKPGSAAVFYFLCVLTALCSVLSKENSAVLPVALALTDIWFFDSAWTKKAWVMCRKTGWKIRVVMVASLLSFSYYAFTVLLSKALGSYSVRDFNLVERLLTEGRVVVWYMSLLLWPGPARLSMEHEVEISTSLFSPLTTFPALFLVASLIFFAVRFRKRFPVITYGIVWFFLNLVIESTIIPLELVFEHRLYLPSMGFYLSVAAIFSILFRRLARRLSEPEFAKATCSLLLIGAACLALWTFIRNEAWENKVTIHYDAAKKAPNNPRASADYANTLCEAGQYEEAIKYAEKAIEIGRKRCEADALAQNAIIVALTKLGKNDEAIERGEDFLRNGSSDIEASHISEICLNVAWCYITEKKPEKAYKWALEALSYVQRTDNASYKKIQVQSALQAIFSQFGPQEVDPTHDVASDPENLLPAIRVAMIFKEHREQQYADEIIEREYLKNPDDPHLAAAFENVKKEVAQNSAQKEKWNSFQKYVRNPFSRYNFDMAMAYLVQEKQLPKFFQELGERRLDDALEISPDSCEARLLKGWYFYKREDADHAVEAARTVLGRDPENSNAWLALGFFLAKAGDSDGAVTAFEKVTELYPGYPGRPVVEALCKQLKDVKSMKSSANRE